MKGRLAAVLRLAGFAAFTLPLMPVQLVFIYIWPRMARAFPHHYHRVVCCILGFKPVVHGALPTGGQCLIVSNHVSWIDIVVLSAVSPLSFVAKREVAKWPFFGWLAKLQRTVFVDRERRQATKGSNDALSTRLAQGDRLVLFPEGTSYDGSSVLPFKSSFFAAATAPDIAIVPVTLAYTKSRGLPLTRRNRPSYAWYGDMDLPPHLWEALCKGPVQVDVIIHAALDVETGLDRKRACAAAENTIRHSLAAKLHGRTVLR
jgi:lyso-ornithine lipid O-acyltransferase